MILGSKIAPYVDGVWGCEFVEDTPLPGYLENAPKTVSEKQKIISQIAYALDNTTKTRAVFEINKGSNKMPDIDVNAIAFAYNGAGIMANMMRLLAFKRNFNEKTIISLLDFFIESINITPLTPVKLISRHY